jgi:CRP/FNR family transcriptional regulator, cyclic AMP receptor protein
MSRGEAAGYFASALVFATFCMKTMIPLRIAAIGSNIAFVPFPSSDHK